MEFGMLLAVILVAWNAVTVSLAVVMNQSQVVLAGRFCSAAVEPASDKQVVNFNRAMRSVSEQVERMRWGLANTTVLGNMYGECMKMARKAVIECLTVVASSAEAFMEGCFLRYTSGGSGTEAKRVGERVRCGGPSKAWDPRDAYVRREFALSLRSTVRVLVDVVLAGDGYGVVMGPGGVEDVFALGRCWNVVGYQECRLCLFSALARLYGECARVGDVEGRAMFEDCYIRYSNERFFNYDPGAKEDESIKRWIVVAGILSSIVLAMIAIFVVYGCYRRISTNGVGETPIHPHNYKLHFKYETLEKATDFFHSTRKLGQGGSGSVFKGILPDGRVVPIKRLFFSTRQWVDEFFNEVNLINGIDHKNLVKLLGCSIEGPESLLVYEFVPNRSLDRVIFERKSSLIGLTWKQRFNIILGVAEGLAYLHGGCGARIIHRDIKANNKLLGNNLVPKIADFGLVRLVASDKTHLSTAIAGTLGYMAPEYLVRGQLTEKADLYTFGVFVLEVVCGRRNNTFTLGLGSILHNVWKLHQENKIIESVDTSLKGEFDPIEASNVLQIGLLCTQASVTLRPSMSDIIEMLSDKDCEIPTPKQPPFLNASLITPDDANTSSSFQVSSEILCSFTVNSSTIYESECHSSTKHM